MSVKGKAGIDSIIRKRFYRVLGLKLFQGESVRKKIKNIRG
jgi:hypothetical protein